MDATKTVNGRLNTNDHPVLLAENAQGRNRYLRGELDEVLIYARALNAREIQALFRLGNRGGR